MRAVLLFFLAYVSLRADSSIVYPDQSLNGALDVYALSYRILGDAHEVWLTLATSASENGKRVLARVSCKENGFSTPEIIQNEMLNHSDAVYNGVPAFHPCDATRVVFVSDRPRPGSTRRSNDLYIAIEQTDNIWKTEPLPFNTDSWEDTPAFGTLNTTLYFASDRRKPGSGAADIYMSHYNGQSWSEPVLLESICSVNDHESSPYVVGNTMYFCSNRNGDEDIYTVSLDPLSGLPIGNARLLELSGVNTRGSNELHPVVTPGGEFIMFSSDRAIDGVKHYRMYYRRIDNAATPVLNLHVTARTLVRDPDKIKYFGKLDSIFSQSSTLRIRDLNRDTTYFCMTDEEGTLRRKVGRIVVAEHPSADTRTRRYEIQAVNAPWGFASTIDTLMIVMSGCDRELDHTIYLIDTTERKLTCNFSFRTFNVPFFVTTYWCPTTRKYRQYTPCTSLFTDDLPCERLPQPDYCLTNEAFTYRFEPARLIRTLRSVENCVDYNEFADSGSVWSDLVDRNIDHMRDEVSSALSDQCVQNAIQAGLQVELTYVGTTDDRSIRTNCMYTGRDFDYVHSFAPHIQVDSSIRPYIQTGQHFNAGGYGGRSGGNQLLSDLRSLYFAILFDNLCRKTIPLYKEYQRQGNLTIRSRGEAIDTRNLPYSLKRAAGIEIRVPMYTQHFAGMKPVPGKSVYLCTDELCR